MLIKRQQQDIQLELERAQLREEKKPRRRLRFAIPGIRQRGPGSSQDGQQPSPARQLRPVGSAAACLSLALAPPEQS